MADESAAPAAAPDIETKIDQLQSALTTAAQELKAAQQAKADAAAAAAAEEAARQEAEAAAKAAADAKANEARRSQTATIGNVEDVAAELNRVKRVLRNMGIQV